MKKKNYKPKKLLMRIFTMFFSLIFFITSFSIDKITAAAVPVPVTPIPLPLFPSLPDGNYSLGLYDENGTISDKNVNLYDVLYKLPSQIQSYKSKLKDEIQLRVFSKVIDYYLKNEMPNEINDDDYNAYMNDHSKIIDNKLYFNNNVIENYNQLVSVIDSAYVNKFKKINDYVYQSTIFNDFYLDFNANFSRYVAKNDGINYSIFNYPAAFNTVVSVFRFIDKSNNDVVYVSCNSIWGNVYATLFSYDNYYLYLGNSSSYSFDKNANGTFYDSKFFCIYRKSNNYVKEYEETHGFYSNKIDISHLYLTNYFFIDNRINKLYSLTNFYDFYFTNLNSYDYRSTLDNSHKISFFNTSTSVINKINSFPRKSSISLTDNDFITNVSVKVKDRPVLLSKEKSVVLSNSVPDTVSFDYANDKFSFNEISISNDDVIAQPVPGEVDDNENAQSYPLSWWQATMKGLTDSLDSVNTGVNSLSDSIASVITADLTASNSLREDLKKKNFNFPDFPKMILSFLMILIALLYLFFELFVFVINLFGIPP